MSLVGNELVKLVEEFVSVSQKALQQNIITKEQYTAMVDNKIDFLNNERDKVECLNINGVG